MRKRAELMNEMLSEGGELESGAVDEDGGVEVAPLRPEPRPDTDGDEGGSGALRPEPRPHPVGDKRRGDMDMDVDMDGRRGECQGTVDADRYEMPRARGQHDA